MPRRINDAIELLEQTIPSTPGSGAVRMYAKSDGKIYSRDDGGIETGPFSSYANYGGPSFASTEIDFGSTPVSDGVFTISDAGIVLGSVIFIEQAAGPYTTKGTLADEATMDSLTLAPVVTVAGAVDVSWSSDSPIMGPIRFNYLISSGAYSGNALTLGYAEVVATQAGISTEADLTGLAVTVTVAAGRRIRISAKIAANGTVASSTAAMNIKEGSTALQNVQIQNSTTAGNGTTLEGEVVLSPSAGTHTYKLTLQLSAGTGTVGLAAASTFPAFILVEDITGQAQPYIPASVPVGVLAQAYKTTNQSTITTEVDLTGLSVNVTVPAGRLLKITAQGLVQVSNTNFRALGQLYQDGVAIGRWVDFQAYGATLASVGSQAIFVSPSAGAHTYKMTLWGISGAVDLLAASGYPASLVVEDVTPTPSTATGAPSSTLAYAEVVATQTGITAETDLTGLVVTVTVPSGRRLKLTAQGIILCNTSASVLSGNFKEGTTYLGRWATETLAAGEYTEVGNSVVVSPSAGTHTYKLSLIKESGAGTCDFVAGTPYPGFLLVEDVTGSGISGHTHTELDDSGWITLPLLNSWVSYDGTYGPPRYRKKAGIVYLQGLAKNGSSAGAIVAQLPVGFRPTIGKLRVVGSSADLFSQFDVAADGNIYPVGASTTFVSLGNVIFPADQ